LYQISISMQFFKNTCFVFSVLLISVISTFSAFSQEVIIKGNAKTYAGSTLELACYADPITNTENKIAQSLVATNGDFEFRFAIEYTQLAFIHLGVFQGFLYIEPGKEYLIVLPEKVQKKIEDVFNPFFEETAFYFKILNTSETELNSMIKKLERLHTQLVAEKFSKSYTKYSKSKVDSIIQEIDNQLPAAQNEYFNTYKYYKFASLRNIAYLRNKDAVVTEFFNKKPIYYHNQSYNDFFKFVFTSCFTDLIPASDSANVFRIIFKQKSYHNLYQHVAKYSFITSDSLRELIIIKGLYDIFYSDVVPKPQIIEIIDSLSLKSKISIHKEILERFKSNATQLMMGYPAPIIQAVDKDSSRIRLDKYAGKFIYLNFCNSKSYSCLKDFELLANLKKQKIEMLEIVSIFVDENLKSFNDFIKPKEYKWNLLYYNHDNEILKKYNVKAYPTYFLIDPEGKLAMYPAPSPTEDFEIRYLAALNSWKNEQLKNKNKKKGLGK